ncbi:MAG: aminotransferase class I/II-fold pyridoxal phosphate-dependent enzyme [Spirosomaceae bacterium]|jgi:glycine C-acetyltransferase|nr:aminotransferase class I/II-fold pyridoxal phosphate-dependent enzyme [Spirosomataceae bacterium]
MVNSLPPQLEFVFDTFKYGKDSGILQLRADNESFDGKRLYINGKETISFNTNNYLDFQDDARVKEAAIEMIRKFGIHTSIPRPFMSFSHFEEAEQKLERIFGQPTLLCNTTSSGHFSYLPLIIGKNDAIIMDQFVHKSVQQTVQYLKADGVYAEFVRHNQTDALEQRIKILQEKYEKVWYLCDGVYSMHGDGAPFSDIEILLNSYDSFYCYVDDAHGMSWIGENGKGYVFHHLPQHDKLFVITSLNKGFGSFCSVMVFPNQKTKDLIRTIGSSIIFSTCPPHSSIGALSAIADIHLSEEIYEKQMRLKENIDYFNKKAIELNIPLANNSFTPIFLVGCGDNDNTVAVAQHIIANGYITGISSYPSVPLKNSGLRTNVNINHTFIEIDGILNAINEVMERLENEGKLNREDVKKSFKSRKSKIVESLAS